VRQLYPEFPMNLVCVIDPMSDATDSIVTVTGTNVQVGFDETRVANVEIVVLN